MTTEYQDALVLAERILDRPNADPDDDLAILARQLLRFSERCKCEKADHGYRKNCPTK